MIFHKGQIVHRACIVEFEGGVHPVVLLGIVATVNPRHDAAPTYHVRNLDGLGHGRNSSTTYSVEEGALYTDPVEAMQVAVDTIAADKSAAQPVTEAANG